jgi:hypothetical protein
MTYLFLKIISIGSLLTGEVDKRQVQRQMGFWCSFALFINIYRNEEMLYKRISHHRHAIENHRPNVILNFLFTLESVSFTSTSNRPETTILIKFRHYLHRQGSNTCLIMNLLNNNPGPGQSTCQYPVASQNDYLQCLETCRPFYFPSTSDGKLHKKLSPRLDDYLQPPAQSPIKIKVRGGRICSFIHF